MELRVDYIPAADGFWAVLSGDETLRGFGATKEEAVQNLIPLLEERFNGTVVATQEVRMIRLAADEPPDSSKALPNALLRAFAKKHKPPAAWYAEDPVG